MQKLRCITCKQDIHDTELSKRKLALGYYPRPGTLDIFSFVSVVTVKLYFTGSVAGRLPIAYERKSARLRIP